VASETIKWTRIAENTTLPDLIRILNRRMSGLETGGEEECPDYCGNGSPEGVITAVIGSEYMQWDAAAGDHPRWTKFSNDSDTGWRRWEGMAGAAGTSGSGYRIGDGSVATGANSIAIGEDESAATAETISIGHNNAVAAAGGSFSANLHSVTGRVVIGYDNTFALGASQEGDHSGVVVVGSDNAMDLDFVQANETPFIVVGTANNVHGRDLEVFGHNNDLSPDGNGSFAGVVVGYGNAVQGSDCFILMGHDSSATGGGGMTVLGTHAVGDGNSTTALGSSSTASGSSSTALGAASTASGTRSITIGVASDATGNRSIACGYTAQATAEGAIALGYLASNAVANTMVIGSATEPIDSITVHTSGGPMTVVLV
jgi:hypothetical protein